MTRHIAKFLHRRCHSNVMPMWLAQFAANTVPSAANRIPAFAPPARMTVIMAGSTPAISLSATGQSEQKTAPREIPILSDGQEPWNVCMSRCTLTGVDTLDAPNPTVTLGVSVADRTSPARMPRLAGPLWPAILFTPPPWRSGARPRRPAAAPPARHWACRHLPTGFAGSAARPATRETGRPCGG